jgi:cytochrome c oxidase assembly protein subunit 15
MPTPPTVSVDAPVPRWLHACAVLTVLLTLPMLVLGAEVTTKKVGMVDRAGLRSPIYLIEALLHAGSVSALIDDKGLGWVIEHSHRTVGFALGFCAVALALGMWRKERRRGVRWAAVLTPFAVLSQGILGILRIELEGRYQDPALGTTIALIHGCTAQLVLALLVAVALWTSRGWTAAVAVPDGDNTVRLRASSVVVLLLVYGQIVLGALVRHKESAAAMRVHILLAFAIAAAVAWLVKVALETQPSCLASAHAALVLAAVVVVQIVLGLETLLSKFSVQWPYTYERVQPLALSPDLIRSVHFLCGALTFSAAVVEALLAYRHWAWAPRPAVAEPPRQLEGAL